jgi:transcriptional regulator with XRE-family HTH domain
VERNSNVVGQNIAKFRWKRSWTQEELAIRLQFLGCNITRQILTYIEIRRCIVTDAQIIFFSEVFSVPIKDLFQPVRSRAIE